MAISDRATDHLEALQMGGCDQTKYTDSDWAANREDRRSVSGGMIVHTGCLLRLWSRRQKAVSLSSWESEFYAAVSTGAEALGLRSGVWSTKGWWTTQHVRDLGWRSTCTRDTFGWKQRGMKARGGEVSDRAKSG